MASIRRRLTAAGRDSHSLGNGRRRHVLLWLLPAFVLVLAVSAAVFASTRRPVVASRPTTSELNAGTGHQQPADLFMQSVVTENGELGWHQLCPDIQARLPLASLVQQADTMRAQAAQAGVHLSVEPLGTHSQQGGWQVHAYRMTAHWANGAVRQWSFNVLTQPSGCVEDVQGQ